MSPTEASTIPFSCEELRALTSRPIAQLQPLPRGRRPRRPPQSEGRQEAHRRAPGSSGVAILQVDRKCGREVAWSGSWCRGLDTDEGQLVANEQNGKQGDSKNLAEASAAAATEAAGSA